VLLDSLGTGAAVLYSRGKQTDAGYRADANFWYLTGVDDPGAILVLAPGEPDDELLFMATRDTDAERWTGLRPALSDSLTRAWGFDRIYRTTSLGGRLVAIMKHAPTLHLISSLVSPTAEKPPDLALYGDISARIPGTSTKNSSRLLERMRMVKTDAEIAALERAISVTHQGISDVIAAMKPGISEFQLDGILEESFKSQGAQFMAFAPIVGCGEQATILHYERRNQPLGDGELLLMDVGAEWDRYAADISRTVPVNGSFSPEQARIYDIVLEAAEAAIAKIRPGVTVREVHEAAREVIRKHGHIEDFLHSTSHFLGLDVHDVGDYGMPLEAGMVITVEPGIYLSKEKIGVRIEDDILVTKNGSRNLSAAIPRDRAAVEAWVKSLQ
jgi:Xaa-Pro aminopeptidase